jgi:hypothetical protein
MQTNKHLVETLMEKFTNICTEIMKAACIRRDPLYQLGHYCKLLENKQVVLIARDQVTKHSNHILWYDYAHSKLSSPFSP